MGCTHESLGECRTRHEEIADRVCFTGHLYGGRSRLRSSRVRAEAGAQAPAPGWMSAYLDQNCRTWVRRSCKCSPTRRASLGCGLSDPGTTIRSAFDGHESVGFGEF